MSTFISKSFTLTLKSKDIPIFAVVSCKNSRTSLTSSSSTPSPVISTVELLFSSFPSVLLSTAFSEPIFELTLPSSLDSSILSPVISEISDSFFSITSTLTSANFEPIPRNPFEGSSKTVTFTSSSETLSSCNASFFAVSISFPHFSEKTIIYFLSFPCFSPIPPSFSIYLCVN